MPKTHIPAVAVVILRSALLSEMAGSVDELDQACGSHEKEKHPERFLVPLHTLDAYREALDAIGWQQPDRQGPIYLDVDAHRAVFQTAMRARLTVERDYMSERARGRGVEQQRATAAANARVIEEFLTATGLSATA
jgi:hypothetical protein